MDWFFFFLWKISNYKASPQMANPSIQFWKHYRKMNDLGQSFSSDKWDTNSEHCFSKSSKLHSCTKISKRCLFGFYRITESTLLRGEEQTLSDCFKCIMCHESVTIGYREWFSVLILGSGFEISYKTPMGLWWTLRVKKKTAIQSLDCCLAIWSFRIALCDVMPGTKLLKINLKQQ